MDDFGVEYVGNQHAENLATIFKNITISLNIGKERSMLASIQNEIFTREHVGQLWMYTSWTLEKKSTHATLKTPIFTTQTTPHRLLSNTATSATQRYKSASE